jgi:hypothetical protein
VRFSKFFKVFSKFFKDTKWQTLNDAKLCFSRRKVQQKALLTGYTLVSEFVAGTRELGIGA